MPPRSVTLAILAFWLATTGWLVNREVLPAFQTGEPPPFIIDLADEVSAQPIAWQALQNGESVGTAVTKVLHRPDRTFVLDSVFTPTKLQLFGVNIRGIHSSYAVTRDGDLRELEATVTASLFANADSIEAGVGGKVVGAQFAPELRFKGIDLKDAPLPKLEPVPVSGHGSVLNPLHPLNRLKGLREGQRWVQPVVDPLVVVVYALIGKEPPLHRLYAEVVVGTLSWHGRDVACWRIDYREPGQRASARTWVRRSDGLVLRQEASHAGLDMVLERTPPR
jgi:hypothetical protein